MDNTLQAITVASQLAYTAEMIGSRQTDGDVRIHEEVSVHSHTQAFGSS